MIGGSSQAEHLLFRLLQAKKQLKYNIHVSHVMVYLRHGNCWMVKMWDTKGLLCIGSNEQ